MTDVASLFFVMFGQKCRVGIVGIGEFIRQAFLGFDAEFAEPFGLPDKVAAAGRKLVHGITEG